MKKQTFTLTKEHLKLLRHFNVGWQDCEYGAPEIDPKRPYGNSSVENDIHEILTGESIGCTYSKRDGLKDWESEKYSKLHKETETALQIVLSVGKFEIGNYEAEEYTHKWVKVGATKEESPKLIRKIYLECVDGEHFKQWIGELYNNDNVITRWGRIGTELQSKEFKGAGEDFLNKKEKEKLSKGYEPV